MQSTQWILLDTETSGLGKPIACVEIGAQKMVGLKTSGAPFRALLNHDVPIEPRAERVHGYSREYLRKNGRDPRSVHEEFLRYANGSPVVSYNLAFDWGRVLEPELARLGLQPTYRPGFCALTLTRRCVSETDGHSMDVVREHFFPDEMGRAHQAGVDVEITRRLMTEVLWPRLERAGITSFDEVAAFSRVTPVAAGLRRIGGTDEAATSTRSGLNEVIAGLLADNELDDAELWCLRAWLDDHPNTVSGAAILVRVMLRAAFEDGVITDDEREKIKKVLRHILEVTGSS